MNPVLRRPALAFDSCGTVWVGGRGGLQGVGVGVRSAVWEAGTLPASRWLQIYRRGGGPGPFQLPGGGRSGRGSGVSELGLLCTQLRTWLAGPTPLSPGTWQAA